MDWITSHRALAALAAAALGAAIASTGTAQTAPVPAPGPCKTVFTDPEPINVGRWVGFDDYPSSALRMELEGVVEVRFFVTALGRVETAEIVTSSGHQVLDDATINLVTRRGRFRPATRKCQPVPGEFTTKFRWMIPQ